MNIFQKMIQKYGSPKETILPPPLETEEDISKNRIPAEKISPFLSQFVLEEGEDALDPKTFDKYEPEKLTWRQNKLPQQITDDFEEIQKELAEDPYEAPTSSQDTPTIPPGKKTSSYNSDHIMRLCSQYHNLCCKL